MVLLEANTSWDPARVHLVRQVLGERPDELQRSALQIALRGVYLYVADAGKGRRLTSKN